MKCPRINIIILNFNGLKDTKKCLNSLLKTTYNNFKIIVGDNGSTKNEAEILEKIYKDKKISFIRFEKNLGFSEGNNRIISNIKSKYVALINNDTLVNPNWLNPLVETLENNDNIAVVQPKILWLENKGYFDYAGACGGFIDIFGYPFTRGRIFETREKDKGQYDKPTDIFWASGACMLIKRSVLEKVGLFDKLFFNYMEEIDLCYRINNQGFRIVCEPKSLIYHKVAATSSKDMLSKKYYEHRNNILLLSKNLPFKKLIYILPARILLEYISLIYYLINKRYAFVYAVILSQISLIIYLPLIIVRNPKRIQKHRIRKLIYPKSIVFSYFVSKKREFSEIINV